MNTNYLAGRITSGNVIRVYKRNGAALWIDAAAQVTNTPGWPKSHVAKCLGYGGLDFSPLPKNPPACGAPKDWPYGYLACGCRNDGTGRHVR